jgi:uncharacterized SAM-binding protein YcdF (DUF218 family)
MVNPLHRLPNHLKRSLKILVIIGVTGFLLDLATVIGFSVLHPMVPPKVDAVVVLGAKVGTPALRNRTLTGLRYFQEGKTNTLVLSGGRGPGEPITEAQAMDNVITAEIAKTHGKMPHILLDTKSTDTYQNLSNSRQLIPHARSIVVVSDCYHLARSVAVAKRVGFQTIYWNSPKPTYYSDIDLAHYYVREAVALVAYIPRFV